MAILNFNTIMLQAVCPKLPMRNKAATLAFYRELLGFDDIGEVDFPEYLLLKRENVELHFFLFPDLLPADNYGQVYIRVNGIRVFYHELKNRGVTIHPNGPLALKPWGQWEFALLDPDHNLLTFGEAL